MRRSSKLTRLLQDVLGPGSLTTIILCVTPSARDAHETLSTLRFGAHAKHLPARPKVSRIAAAPVVRAGESEPVQVRGLTAVWNALVWAGALMHASLSCSRAWHIAHTLCSVQEDVQDGEVSPVLAPETAPEESPCETLYTRRQVFTTIAATMALTVSLQVAFVACVLPQI